MDRDELVKSIIGLTCESSVKDELLVLANQPQPDQSRVRVLEERIHELTDLLNEVRIQLRTDLLTIHEKSILAALVEVRFLNEHEIQDKTSLSFPDMKLALANLLERIPQLIDYAGVGAGYASYHVTSQGRRLWKLAEALSES